MEASYETQKIINRFQHDKDFRTLPIRGRFVFYLKAILLTGLLLYTIVFNKNSLLNTH